MVEGILTYLDHFPAPPKHPSRDRLAEILGVVDKRVQFSTLDETLLTRTKTYSVYRVRWPALNGVFAEGLHFKPLGKPVGRAVAIPDADQTPEASDISPRLAAQGYEVLALAILDRSDTYSGNPNVRMTNQPHREFVYAGRFFLGRDISFGRDCAGRGDDLHSVLPIPFTKTFRFIEGAFLSCLDFEKDSVCPIGHAIRCLNSRLSRAVSAGFVECKAVTLDVADALGICRRGARDEPPGQHV